MSNKMLIDATHPEETRVVIVRDKRVEDFDFETASKRPLRGNIYLAKVTRVEPSLQAAFVEYGGNRHGFLAFSEIHPDYYQIPQADRVALMADLDAAAEAEDRGSPGGGNGSGNGGRDRRRRRGGRGGDRPRPQAAAPDTASDSAGGVVEVVDVEEDDDDVEAAGAAAGGDREADEAADLPLGDRAEVDEADDDAALPLGDRAQEDEDDDIGGEEDDAGPDDDGPDAGEREDPEKRHASERAEDEAWLRAVASAQTEQPDIPAPRIPSLSELDEPETAAEELVPAAPRGSRREAIEAGAAVSSEEMPGLERARRQVEETMEADVEAAIDMPAGEFEADVAQAETEDDGDAEAEVARNAASAAADAAAATPAKSRGGRKPATARPRKPAEKPAATAKAAAAKRTAAAAADGEDDAPGDEDAAPEADAAPKKRRAPAKRAPAKRTTKKSDTGLADPAVSDDDEPEEVLEQLGGDAQDEVPERRRLTPRRQYKIQEVIKRRQILLVQVVKEERGTKGAALTTYLSLAGRYSVLMPNTDRGGGVSRKITDSADRRRLKELVEELDVPEGMGIILRTAGANRTTMEIKRDFEYLIRLWESVRDLTLKSIAPALVYEEGNLVKRAIRDQYSKEIDEILVSGEPAYDEARSFMKMLMPSQEAVVKPYRDPAPIFTKYGVESQLDAMFSPQVTLPAKGYIVINPTEALVSIDVNSGRSTKEHSIEDTALKTNLEAADEIARQLRLRDLAGLIVIDFIDMDDKRHNRQVEMRLKNALRLDRSRIQIGRISPFGLLEMSRQRMRQGMVETSMVPCATCGGTGHVRSTQSVALHCLRMLEEHLLKHGEHNVTLKTSSAVALYILNQKRAHLNQLEERFSLEVEVHADETLAGQHLEIVAGALAARDATPAVTARVAPDAIDAGDIDEPAAEMPAAATTETADGAALNGERGGGRRRRRRRRRGGGERGEARPLDGTPAEDDADEDNGFETDAAFAQDGDELAEGVATADEEATAAADRAAWADEAEDDGDAAVMDDAEDDGDAAAMNDAEEADDDSDAAAIDDAEQADDEAAEADDEDAYDEPSEPAAARESSVAVAPTPANDAGAAREHAPERKSEPDRPRRSGWWKPRG